MEFAIIRISFYIMVIALVALCGPAHADGLRGSQIHICGDVVTLGEVFDVTEDADVEIAKAPPAGKSISLDAGTLYGLATLHHIAWSPRSSFDHVIVIRDGGAREAGLIPASYTPASSGADASAPSASSYSAAAPDLGIILPPLKVALAGQSTNKFGPDKFDIVLDGGIQQHILAAIPADSALTVENLEVPQTTVQGAHHFTATLVNAATGDRYPVAGKNYALIDVPVPARKIAEGDIVREGDLTSLTQREDKLRSDTVTKPETLIGKVAKHALEANLPVQERNVGVPILVKRGDRVTMIVTGNGITLTATGLAMSDAGMGETVKLANAASNRTVEGIVTGANTATIRTDTAIVAANTVTETPLIGTH